MAAPPPLALVLVLLASSCPLALTREVKPRRLEGEVLARGDGVASPDTQLYVAVFDPATSAGPAKTAQAAQARLAGSSVRLTPLRWANAAAFVGTSATAADVRGMEGVKEVRPALKRFLTRGSRKTRAGAGQSSTSQEPANQLLVPQQQPGQVASNRRLVPEDGPGQEPADQRVPGEEAANERGPGQGIDLPGVEVPRDAPNGTCSSCTGLADAPPDLLLAETVPYGISMVQANSPEFLGLTGGPSAAGVTVCIIDTGLDSEHPDLAGEGNSLDGYTPYTPDPNDPNGELLYQWNTTFGAIHSTHVTGTVAALHNQLGVIGVIAGGTNTYNVNVFGPYAFTSDFQIIEALEACYETLQQRKADDPLHKMVVSMSLGGGGATFVEDAVFSGLYARGDVLFVASAGNGGDDQVEYPAGYASVISVAAVDCSETVADFSTFNADVELAAPGVDVLSTLPDSNYTGLANLAVVQNGTTVARLALPGTDGTLIDPVSQVSGAIVDCGEVNGTCPEEVKGNICLIDRGPPGSPVLCGRVRTCMDAGATAVIVIANDCTTTSFTLDCTLFDPNCTCPYDPGFVPSFGVARSDGLNLRRLAASGVSGDLFINYLWGSLDGTSMAAPHVSSLAAKLWNSFRGCSNDVIRQALAATALDLGTPGRDENYGFGLVQGVAAAQWLKQQPCAAAAAGPTAP